jgi:hypothetical protein
MKIMLKSLSRHQVRLQGNLKLKKKKNLYIRTVFLYFLLFQCTSHQPISVADLG